MRRITAFTTNFTAISITIFFIVLALCALPAAADVESDAGTNADTNAKSNADTNAKSIDIIWTLLAAFLVFLMQAGFAMLETGMTRAKSACNIMMKNLMDFSLGALIYWAIGFGLMFGAGNMFFGASGFFLKDVGSDTWQYVLWMFQVVFAATAATIVSGAVAERMKFNAYLWYTLFLTGLVYPIVGHWIWGEGWLSQLGFIDFAGSTVVHSVGGWAGLAGTLVLGPRIGKYASNKIRPIKGHSIPLAALGVFILWFGWYGFNAGSTTAGTDWTIAAIVVTTTLGAAAGAVGAMITSWHRENKPDVGLTLGGTIAGLVAITAGTANISPVSSVIIGAIGGILYVYSVAFLDKLKIDDPVGAVPAHAVAGAWGTIAVGLFAEEAFGGVNGLFFGGGIGLLTSQIIGIIAVFVFVFGTMAVFFKGLDLAIGLRVSKEEELRGLDLSEHNAESYADFGITATT